MCLSLKSNVLESMISGPTKRAVNFYSSDITLKGRNWLNLFSVAVMQGLCLYVQYSPSSNSIHEHYADRAAYYTYHICSSRALALVLDLTNLICMH